MITFRNDLLNFTALFAPIAQFFMQQYRTNIK